MEKCRHIYEYVNAEICPDCGRHTHEPDWKYINEYAKQWLKDYALASAKIMLGQARSKFASLAGPQGGVQLNGNDLINQGQAEIEKLEEDLKTYTDGGTPLSFIIG